MDVNKLVEVLRATLVPAQREQAEQQLNEVSENVIHFMIMLIVNVTSNDSSVFCVYAQ